MKKLHFEWLLLSFEDPFQCLVTVTRDTWTKIEIEKRKRERKKEKKKNKRLCGKKKLFDKNILKILREKKQKEKKKVQKQKNKNLENPSLILESFWRTSGVALSQQKISS